MIQIQGTLYEKLRSDKYAEYNAQLDSINSKNQTE